MNITKGFFIAIALLGLVNAIGLHLMDKGKAAGGEAVSTAYQVWCADRMIHESSETPVVRQEGYYTWGDGRIYVPQRGDYCEIKQVAK